MGRRRCGGVTLTELLVVVAIISILAGLLLPVYAKARESARGATCTSHLKQLAAAMLMYAGDYDDGLPAEWSSAGHGYRESVQPYVQNLAIFRCPSQAGDTHVSYGMPAWTAYEAAWRGAAQLATAQEAATTALLAENWSSYYSTRDPVHWPTRSFPDLNNVAWGRHRGGANYAFADGHVKRLTRDQTYRPTCVWWAWSHEASGECGGR